MLTLLVMRQVAETAEAENAEAETAETEQAAEVICDHCSMRAFQQDGLQGERISVWVANKLYYI